MVSPEDQKSNAYMTDVYDMVDKYRKFSFKINITSPKFPFSTCTSSDGRHKGKAIFMFQKLTVKLR